MKMTYTEMTAQLTATGRVDGLDLPTAMGLSSLAAFAGMAKVSRIHDVENGTVSVTAEHPEPATRQEA